MIKLHEKLKKIGYTFVTVFLLGWLANYSYEVFGISSVFDNVLTLIPNIFYSLLDRSVGKAVHSLEFPYLKLVWVVLVPTIHISAFYSFLKNERKRQFKTFWIYYTLMVIISLYGFFLWTFDLYVYYKIVPSVKNHIEILEPYIPEDKYKLMKSDYYRLNTYDEYGDLREEIHGLMRENRLDSSQVPYQPSK